MALTQQQAVQAVLQARDTYATHAPQQLEAPFGQIDYKANGRGTLPIPTGFLLEGLVAHVSLDVTTSGQTGYSFLAEKALVEEAELKVASDATLMVADGTYLDQHMLLENPLGNMSAANNLPAIAASMHIDAYFDVPAVYSAASLLGIQNVNDKKMHPTVNWKWGDVANMFIGGTADATATGYVEFIAKRVLPPQSAADGAPDLTKIFAVAYQDFALSGSKNNRCVIEADATVTRIVVNLLEGGTGNGSDVASYDSSNALQLTDVKLGWASFTDKMDEVPYWFFQQEAAKNYGVSFAKYINAGTIVIDLDRFGGRDWIEAQDITNFAVTLNLGAAPPAHSKARVYVEQIINTSQSVPIRG